MKAITSLSLILTAFAASTALADDPQLQNRLAVERAKATQASTTVAVYSQDRGLGHSDVRAAKTETRFELRSNARGQTFGLFVPVNK